MTHNDMFSRYSRASLSLDSVGSQTDEESSNPSPASASASPLNGFPPSGSLLYRPKETKDVKIEDEYHQGLQIHQKTGIKVGREKRKRSRVTSEQLAHLEAAFEQERSPTASDRKMIADFLGMNERQTQIWFQNRRAKAKVQDGKPHAQKNGQEKSSKSSPYAAEIKIVHEDQPVSIIPCSDLTIGSWRRVSSGGNTQDLVAYVCNARRSLNWFIRSSGYGFKMEVPFTTILDTEYKLIGDRTGVASFALSEPPIFYLEDDSVSPADKAAGRSWRRCSDWTEGHQASHVLRHTLVGSDAHLANVLRNLHSSPPTGAPAPNVGAAGYRSDRVMTSPMELPPPPLAALSREGPSYPDAEMKGCDRAAEFRRRSLYSNDDDRYTDARSELRQPHSASDASFPRTNFMRPQPGHFDSAAYNEYTMTHIQQRADSNAYSAVSAGLAIYSRPQGIQQQSYFQGFPPSRMPMQPFHPEMSRAPSLGYPTPSPPLMVPKYEAEMDRNRHSANVHHISPQPMHGIPNMMYDAEGMRSR